MQKNKQVRKFSSEQTLFYFSLPCSAEFKLLALLSRNMIHRTGASISQNKGTAAARRSSAIEIIM